MHVCDQLATKEKMKSDLEMLDIESLRKDVVEALRAGVCEITFTKVNGEQRVMPCTLKEDLLPARNQKDLSFETPKEIKTDVVSVWCVDANGWRSFKLSNFISINPLNDYKHKNLDGNT